MTIDLNLKPEIESGLVAQAQYKGMKLEDYVLWLLERVALSGSQESLSAEERAAAFEAWSASHGETPLLSDYAVSRQGIYEGRE